MLTFKNEILDQRMSRDTTVRCEGKCNELLKTSWDSKNCD